MHTVECLASTSTNAPCRGFRTRHGQRFARERDRAIAAFLGRRPFDGRPLQVELRAQPHGEHPVTGRRFAVPDVSILWQEAVPAAVLVHRAVVVRRGSERSLREAIAAAAHAQGASVDLVPEGRLWQLLGPPGR